MGDDGFDRSLKPYLSGKSNIIIVAKMAKENLVGAVRRARKEGMCVLEEQGISAIALVMSKTLMEIVENPRRLEAPI